MKNAIFGLSDLKWPQRLDLRLSDPYYVKVTTHGETWKWGIFEKWLLPSDFNPAEAEFTHLLDTADADKDGNLNLTEILEKYFILLEFQTTKWGQITHDELWTWIN